MQITNFTKEFKVNLKRLLMRRGLKQIEVAKLIGANHSLVSMQLNKHRLLPEKYHSHFCEILGISREELLASMNEEGGKSE